MATSIDQKNFVKTALRLPPDLHAAVHASAQESGRSYNAELVDRIQRSYETGISGEASQVILGLQFDLASAQTNMHILRLRITELAEEIQAISAQAGSELSATQRERLVALSDKAGVILERHRSDISQLRAAYEEAEIAASDLAFAIGEKLAAEGQQLLQRKHSDKRLPKP